MTRDEATKLLGLLPEEVGSPQSIRSAFSNLARKLHPDTRSQGPDPDRVRLATVDMDRLKSARDLMLSYLATSNLEQEIACGSCAGSGMFRMGFRWRTCGACDGTGVKR